MPEKPQKGAGKTKRALPAMGTVVRRAEQVRRQERLQQDLELRQRQLPQGGLVRAGTAEFLE